MTDPQDWVKITRVFDAPIALVWQMWTDPAAFQKWYGPMGMRVPEAEMDVRVGGTRKIAMQMDAPPGPSGSERKMWFTGVYKEITPPTRLVYTEAMCDENGVLIPPSAIGMPEGHPEITEVIVELREVGDQTEMVMVHVGVPDGSPGAGGWAQAFEKLAANLAG